jgi:UDP-GlcNAc:undecaprenyl-phosphate/decaprenyl-phosphate GlcNAc-1-phosphate transferase
MIINLLTYSLISFLILNIISNVSYYFNLTDKPTKRKSHLKPTAHTGGIALCLLYFLSIFLFNFSNQKFDLVFSTAILVGLIGFIDDRYNLNAFKKIFLLIFPILYLVIIENFRLNELGNYNDFKLQLGIFSIPFTVIAVLLLVNSFNYFDGLDGTLCFSIVSVIFILFFLIADKYNFTFLLAILIPILFFLIFNFSLLKLPKLFLGDSGSLSLGFIISFTLIYLGSHGLVHPILLAFSISIFVFEFLSINLIRLRKSSIKKIFSPGRDHLHHLIFFDTKSVFLTNLIIFLINILIFMIGYISFVMIGAFVSMIVFIICFILFIILRNSYSKKFEILSNDKLPN